MTNSTTNTVYSLAKCWFFEVFVVVALSLLLPVGVSAKNSLKLCSYSDFDNLTVAYYKQNKIKEGKTAIAGINTTNRLQNANNSVINTEISLDLLQGHMQRTPVMPSSLVAANYPEGSKPDKVVKAVITAYTSTPDQTDSTPDIAASGKKVYDGMIAANWLPFGTKIKIPALFGDKVFTVDDRMNKRYGYGRLDVWLDTSKTEAKKFGVKRVDVLVFLEKTSVKKLTLAK